MNSIFKLFTPMAVAALLSLPAAAIRLDATNSIMMMKPLQGITFDVGTKRAVSYFLSDNGTCKLVLTLAETIGPDDQVPNAESTRFEAAIKSDRALRYIADAGQQVEFACQANAETMNVRLFEEIIAAALGG